MHKIARVVGLLASLGVAGATSPPAAAESASTVYHFRTRIVEQAPSVGEFDGALQLTVSPDGDVNGYYRPDADPKFISVTGGIRGTKLWFDIGTFATNPMRFSGTLDGGKLSADATGPYYDDGRLTGLTMIGTPSPH